MIQLKDYGTYYNSFVRYDVELPIYSRYCFIVNDCILFIKKSRGFYKLVASAPCRLKFLYREKTFDVIFQDKILENVIEQYFFCVKVVLCRVFRR